MELLDGGKIDAPKPCIWCAEEIHPQAKLCKNCKKHQQPWIENILMFGSMLGVVTFIIGAWSYIVGEYHAFQDARSQPSIRLVDLKSTHYAVVQNTGKRPVYVSSLHYDFSVALGETGIVTLNQKIDPGELFTRDLKVMIPVGGVLVEKKYFFANEKILAEKDIEFLKQGKFDNFKPIIYNEESIELSELASRADKLEGKCNIQYAGAGSKETIKLKFGCVAVPGFHGDNGQEAIKAFFVARPAAAP